MCLPTETVPDTKFQIPSTVAFATAGGICVYIVVGTTRPGLATSRCRTCRMCDRGFPGPRPSARHEDRRFTERRRRETLAERKPLFSRHSPLATRNSDRSGHRDRVVEVDILDGVEQLDAIGHGTLEGLAARDQAHAAGTLVDDGRLDGIGLISGRKAFQRPMADGVKLLNAIQDVYLDDSITVA